MSKVQAPLNTVSRQLLLVNTEIKHLVSGIFGTFLK